MFIKKQVNYNLSYHIIIDDNIFAVIFLFAVVVGSIMISSNNVCFCDFWSKNARLPLKFLLPTQHSHSS